SFNNHWGVPLTLARMPRSTAFAVIEVGMNHAGEIRSLVDMVRPHGALVTTVEPVHLEFFADVGEIADAKAEIFEGLVSGGVAVINADNPHAGRLHGAARSQGARAIVHFGAQPSDTAPDPSIMVRCTRYLADYQGAQVSADVAGTPLTFRLQRPGRHIAQNALGILGLTTALGLSPAAVADGFADHAPGGGRGAREVLSLADGGEVLLLDESYNANPASMRAAFSILSQVDRARYPRRIAVLGDMLELGHQSQALHAELAGPLRDAGADLVLSCGPHMADLMAALPVEMRGGHAQTSAGLVDQLRATVRAGDVVVFKGSLGSRIGPLVTVVRELTGAAART
ncbi:MAG: Mur ligase family protein, partial [Pseudomonadota bacterium]